MHANPEVLALLALGEEATQAEREHVSTCDVCSREVAELAHLAGVGRSVSGADRLSQPSPVVWERIRAEIGWSAPAGIEPVEGVPVDGAPNGTPAEARLGASVVRLPDRAESPQAGAAREVPAAEQLEPTDLDARRAIRRRRVITALVAAALALVVGVGLGLGWGRLSRPVPTVLAKAQLSALPAWAGSTGEATLEQDSDGSRVLRVNMQVGRTMTGNGAAWLLDPATQQMVPLGLMSGQHGVWTVPSTVDLHRYSVLDISTEALHDNTLEHSGNSILRGTLTT